MKESKNMKRKPKNIITIILILVLLVCMYFIVTNNVSNNQSSVQNNQMGSMMSQSELPEKTNDNSNMNNGNNMMNDQDNIPQMNNEKNSNIYYYIVLGLEGLITSSLIIYLFMSKFNKKSIKETFKSGDKIIIYLLSLALLTIVLTYSSDKLLSNNSTNKDNQMNNNMESENVTYKGAEEITKDTTISSGEYESTNSDENAILISGDITSSLSNIIVTKKGDSTSADGDIVIDSISTLTMNLKEKSLFTGKINSKIALKV